MDRNVTPRGIRVVTAAVLTLAVVGFFGGLHLPVAAEAAPARAAAPPAKVTGPVPPDDVPPPAAVRGHQRPASPGANLLVRVPRPMAVTGRPGGGRVVGTMPSTSRYYHQPIRAWVMRISSDGRFGRVSVPYAGAERFGWIRLAGLRRSKTTVTVRVDLSAHRIWVERGDRTIMRFPAATGAPASPTPPGEYFVTDRVAFPAGGVFGTFAFGISGIQTRLPVGWNAGDQLAIHGTNAPSTIGTSASAGCLRVSEAALARLEPLLRLGTPVVIRP